MQIVTSTPAVLSMCQSKDNVVDVTVLSAVIRAVAECFPRSDSGVLLILGVVAPLLPFLLFSSL